MHIVAAGGLWYIATIWSYSMAIDTLIICYKKSIIISIVCTLCNVVWPWLQCIELVAHGRHTVKVASIEVN